MERPATFKEIVENRHLPRNHHTRRNTRTALHRAEIGKEQEQEASEDTNSEGGQMFVANEVLLADIGGDEWIIDSGASRHMMLK